MALNRYDLEHSDRLDEIPNGFRRLNWYHRQLQQISDNILEGERKAHSLHPDTKIVGVVFSPRVPNPARIAYIAQECVDCKDRHLCFRNDENLAKITNAIPISTREDLVTKLITMSTQAEPISTKRGKVVLHYKPNFE